jgi:DNA-binding beta-propeller fold protein YncE
MKNKKNVALIIASICLLTGLSIFPLWEPVWSMYSTVSPPFVQCDVGLGFPNNGVGSGFGPVGQVPLLGGQILTADPVDSSLRTYVDYPSPYCTPSYVSPNLNSSGNTYGGLAQGFDGKIYAITYSASLVEIDKTDGLVIRTLDNTSFSVPVGITVDPMNGDLYITDQYAGKVFKISDPGGCTTCTATLFADLTVLAPPPGLNIDGLGWSPDGFSLLVVAAKSDQVILVDRNGTPSVFVNVGPGDSVHPDGVAFGCPGTPLWTPAAQFAFTNNNNGTVTEINMITKGVTTIALGGTRGDFTAVDDEGTLLATQSDRVTRLSTTNGGRFCLAGGGLCSNLQSAAAVATNSNFCVINPSVKATIKRLVKPICGNLTCNPALAQKQICSLISFVKANAPNCTGLLTAARTLRDQLSTVSPSPCPGT